MGLMMDDQKFEKQVSSVVLRLKNRKLSVVTAESCTAGLLSALLSKAEGAGEVLKGGFVCYAKDQKTIALGVPADLLNQKTAVAGEVVTAMALGALEQSNADLALAVTGVLGPEPDEDGNPVGLVYIARCSRDGDERVARHNFGHLSHDELCAKTLNAAVLMLDC
jgi:nicotinamide-nucleotide amidase